MTILYKHFIQKAEKIHGDRYDYSLVKYKNNKTKVKIICPVHGVFEQTPGNHINLKHICPKCSYETRNESKKLTTEQFIEKAKTVHGDKYDYSLVKYKNARTKVKIICTDHGVFEQIPNSHLKNHGCPKCKYKKLSSLNIDNNDLFVKKSNTIHNNKYDYSLVEYKTTWDKVKIICPVHGVFEQTPNAHIQGQGCPKCACIISKQETELQSFISSLDIECIFNDRQLITPYELDIVIPSYNIAIEYNGLYWHGEQQGKGSKYHLNKYNLCKEKGYRLIQIWENEWLFKQDIVKSILINALGKTPHKIHGRKCRIIEVKPKEARSFYNENHIQGFKGGRHIGLKYNDKLVSLMTIDSRGELQRFVNKKYHNVYGAFSKLLKSFINEGYNSIYTFADLRWFTGNVYEKNGFEYVYHVKPRYNWFKDLDIYHRRYFQKKNIERYYNKGELSYFNPDKTEYQNMLANGYDRIWDCGKIKFIRSIYE